MADTPISNQIAQTATDVSTAAGNAGSKGFSQGIQLAQAADDMQQKQLQTAKMKDELDMGRANALIQRISTQNKIGDDRLRQTYAKQNDQWAQKNGLAYPGFFSDHAGQDSQQRIGPLLDIISGKANTPESSRAALAAVSDPAQLDQALNATEEQKKQQNQLAMEHEKSQTAKYGADQRRAGQEASSGAGSSRYEGMLQREAGRIHNDSRIKTFSQQIDMLDNIKGIINNSKGVTNQEFNDSQAEISNAIAGARNAALGKLERTEYTSYEQEIKALKQKISGLPATDAVPPEILERFKELIDHTQNSFITHRSARANGLLRTSKNPDVMRTQKEAIEQYSHPDEVQPGAPVQPAPTAGSPSAPSADTFQSFMNSASKQPGFNYQKAAEAFQKLHPQGK